MNERIAVLGGSGFVGSRLCSALVKLGYEVRVLTRQLSLQSDVAVLPGVRPVRTDPYDVASLTGAITGCTAVVNLVGILNEPGRDGSGFEKAHVSLVENLISAMRDAGVVRLIQMSALRAGEGESYYLKSKGRAEEAVFSSGLNVTAIRPSVIFGPGDSFINRFAQLLKWFPVMPLACADSRFAPVYVGDVAQSMVAAIRRRDLGEKALELTGPDEFSLREIVEFVCELLGIKRWIIDLPNGLARMQAAMMDFVPGKPFSTDNYLSLQLDSVSERNDLPSLGITPAAMSAIVPDYLPGSLRSERLTRYRERER